MAKPACRQDWSRQARQIGYRERHFRRTADHGLAMERPRWGVWSRWGAQPSPRWAHPHAIRNRIGPPGYGRVDLSPNPNAFIMFAAFAW